MKCIMCVITVCAIAAGGNAATGQQASAILEGRAMAFPESSIDAGTKATIDLLESCATKRDGAAAELTEALKADHVRLVFDDPASAEVMGEDLHVAEVVFTQPLNKGVLWVRAGDRVVRFAKWNGKHEKAFVEWRNKATVVK